MFQVPRSSTLTKVLNPLMDWKPVMTENQNITEAQVGFLGNEITTPIAIGNQQISVETLAEEAGGIEELDLVMSSQKVRLRPVAGGRRRWR